MKDTNYAFCVARIRALENKMLDKQDISNLIEQKSYESALNYLSDKGYKCEKSDLEAIMQEESDALQAVLNESVPDKTELDSLYLINDYFNIKALVKCAVSSTAPEGLLIFPSTVVYNKGKSIKDTLESLDEKYRDVALNAYDMALKTHNGKYGDAIIDRAAIDALSKVSLKKNSGLVGEICAFLADTANIKTAFRCSATNQDADYIYMAIGSCCKLDRSKLIEKTIEGTDGLSAYLCNTEYKVGAEVYISKPSDFEKWCDNELIKKIGSAIYTSFGFGPVVSYYYRKNLEIKTVRMILTALKSGTDKKIIYERVRQFYV